MNKIKIKNLRSLKDTKDVELKPLTIIVGKNSSGKSTFLRFFPLMKQTLETRTNEPILWYSSRFVDFGSFDESVNLTSEKKTISFEFEFDILRDSLQSGFLSYRFGTFMYYRKRRIQIEHNQPVEKEYTKCRVAIEFSKQYINRMTITIEDHKFEINMIEKEKFVQLKVNNTVYNQDFLSTEHSRDFLSILPKILIKRNETIINCEEYFKDKLFMKLKGMAHAATKDETIEEYVNSIFFGDSDSILDNFKNRETSANSLLEKIRLLTSDEDIFIELKNLFVGMYTNKVIELCNTYLESYFSSVRYIAPLRASAERYYRIQGLSVNEIDPRGENIPMILHNMRNSDKRQFNNWLKENFGFEITTIFAGGHTSLRVKYKSGQEINLADTGFGYSQILPIILVLWQATQDQEKTFTESRIEELTGYRSFFTIVIEQPELHLHPALQAMLIDAFAKVIQIGIERGINIKIIIETHSETMVNRVGYLIAKKYNNFNNDFVNVLIFDNSSNSYETTLDKTSFSNDGYITSWPLGFFGPEGL